MTTEDLTELAARIDAAIKRSAKGFCRDGDKDLVLKAARIGSALIAQHTPGEDGLRAEFETWVKDHNEAEIRWIGHSYANAYMAAQWEGFKAAHTRALDKLMEGME